MKSEKEIEEMIEYIKLSIRREMELKNTSPISVVKCLEHIRALEWVLEK